MIMNFMDSNGICTVITADFLGYEALSEFVISQLLHKTNIPSFVDYQILLIQYLGKTFTGCCSNDFRIRCLFSERRSTHP